MAELDEMKNLVSMLKAENEKIAKMTGSGNAPGGSDTGESADTTQVDKLSELLAMKQRELENVLSGGGGGGGSGDNNKLNAQEEMMQRQREEYAKRGIHLTFFESETQSPYLINLDVDAYRSNRVMFIFTQPLTVVGTNGDIKPMSLSIVDNHCSFEKQNEDGEITLIAGHGEVVHNGVKIDKAAHIVLKAFDRIAIGNELMLFRYPGNEPEGAEIPSADDAVREYQKALQTNDNAAMLELQAQLQKFEEEKAAWEKQKAEAQQNGATQEQIQEQEEQQRLLEQQEKERLARQVNDQELRDVLPKINELQQIVNLLNRDMLSFETALQGSGDSQSGIPKVKVKVHNSKTQETILLDVFEFVKAHALLKDEVAFLKNAIANGREYTSPEGHDPITLLFDNSFQVWQINI